MRTRTSSRLRASALGLGVSVSMLFGCGPAPEEEDRPVELRFDAIGSNVPLRCGVAVDGLGTSNTRYELKDLRFYVHDIRLVSADGTEHPVTLEADGAWQNDQVALLDFEDRTGECGNGTVEMNDRVKGRVKNGVAFTEVRFQLGVPEALNHADASVAQAPMNLTSLFWSWRAGYKFLRLDGKTEGNPAGHNLHLGSTGCSEAPTTCTEPNRPQIALKNFDETKHAITLDASALLATTDLTANAPGTPPGCMGAPVADADCSPLFEKLGLGDGPQSTFILRERAE